MSRKNKTSSVIYLLLSMVVAVQNGKAQSVVSNEEALPLRAEQFRINRLASDRGSDQAVFTIDGATTIHIEIISNIGTIQTSIVTPSGSTITPDNINGIGGEFIMTGGTATANSFLIIPSLTRNFHYSYSLPGQGAGNYTVRFQAPANLSEEVAILTNVTWDSTIAAKLFITESMVKTGSPSILTAALFKGTGPIANATVEVTIVDSARNKTTLNLLDNGPNNTDDQTGDGLYGGEFTPTTVGRYSIVAKMTGTAPDGTAFIRNALTEFEAVAPKGQLSGVISDQGVDNNADGLIDRIAFSVGTQTNLAGTYQAFVHLKTQSGKPLVGSGTAALANGSGQIEANVTAEVIRDVNENGPYTIELVELEYLDATQGSEAADRRRDLGQTAAYIVSQFQRRPLILTGVVTEQGVDTNSNGKFDRLRVAVQVDVLVAGAYDWTLKLSDQGFGQIDVAAGNGQLSTGVQSIVVEFDGLKIGAAGLAGPYIINDLLLFGPRSLVTTEIGRTRAYLPEQFEGGQPSAISFLLVPQSFVNLRIGTSHTLTVTITNSNNPVANQEVTFRIIDGPNTGQRFTAQTNAQGIATTSYTSQTPGTDTIDATFVDSQGRTRLSNQVTASWIENITIDLAPSTATHFILTNTALTATVLNSNNPVPNTSVAFNVVSGPNTGRQLIAQTNTQGVATANYTSAISGTDTIQANVTIGSTVITSNQVTVVWISNRAPVCTNATPSIPLITQPDRRFVTITVQGVSDPDNDALTISINSIRQDEPVDHTGDGSFAPDSMITGGAASVRAESIFGTVVVDGVTYVGNGRFYHIGFTATDAFNQTCTGIVRVAVPHVRTATPIDDGPLFDSTSPAATSNPLDNADAQFFVQQHYYDFLNREPDAGGLDYWAGMITQCGADQACVRSKRVDVSNAFFYEQEFQQTGSYVYRLYRAAYGNAQPFPNPNPDITYPNEERKLPSYDVFVRDRARVVGGAHLVTGQQNLANEFVGRPEFLAKYSASLDGPGFVDAILATIKNDIGVDLTHQRTALINLFNSGGRGAVLYRLADDNLLANPINNRAFIDAEYNRSFVYSQYAGYLRRNSDIGGFQFWLGQISRGALRDGNVQHAMVCSFITSSEFQLRFSPLVTRTNQECAR